MERPEAVFGDATVQALFEEARPACARHLKLGKDALKLKAELLRVFVDEAVSRSGQLARQEGFSEINPEHIEKVLPQLLLDFS